MSTQPENVAFETLLESTCAQHDCQRAARDVAIVTGDYGTDCLAGYCPACADRLDDSQNHTFIGRVQR